MSQYKQIIKDDELGTEYTVAWGVDLFSGAEYLIVFDKNREIKASLDVRYDDVTKNDILDTAQQFGVNRSIVDMTLRRKI